MSSITLLQKSVLIEFLGSIVAVPGLGAHAFGTWKGRNGYKMWLRDFLPKDKAFEKARILLYGYRSDLKGNTSKDSIQDYARRLLMQLQHVRSKGEVCIRCFDASGLRDFGALREVW